MIRIVVAENTVKSLEKNENERSVSNILKKAINDTAKQTRKQLASEAQKAYVIKSGRFNKAMTLKNATNNNLEAVVGATGRVTELKDFKVSPAKVQTNSTRPEVVKAKGLKKNGLKKLQKGDIKAFVVRFASGHVSVAQRLTSKRLPLKLLYSTSIPKMLGNEKNVFGKVEPDIYKNLQLNLEKYIAQARRNDQ